MKPKVTMEDIEQKARELIKGHIESMNGLEMSSVKHFIETNRVSGSFYLALKDMVKEGYQAGESAKQKEIEWISVKYRLPEKIMPGVNPIVLAYYPETGTQATVVFKQGKFHDYTGRMFGDVSHWRPLPEPPKFLEELEQSKP